MRPSSLVALFRSEYYLFKFCGFTVMLSWCFLLVPLCVRCYFILLWSNKSYPSIYLKCVYNFGCSQTDTDKKTDSQSLKAIIACRYVLADSGLISGVIWEIFDHPATVVCLTMTWKFQAISTCRCITIHFAWSLGYLVTLTFPYLRVKYIYRLKYVFK